MRKLLGLCLIVCAVFAVLVVANVEAARPELVKICSICPRGSSELPNGNVVFFGWVREIPLPALPGRLRRGDFGPLPDDATLGACCAFQVTPDGTYIPGVD